MIVNLVNDVLAYIILGQKEVALSITNNKKHNVLVAKSIDRPCSGLVLGENEFKLRLSVKPDYKGVEAYIKSPKFPNPNEEYKVINFLESSAYQILSEINNNNGVFDNKFEAVFIDKDVSFITEGMSNYDEAMDEMMRKFYTEMGKKTKKWVPGHRYDSADETFYYLGSFLSRKKEEFNSSFYNVLEELTVVHLYVNTLRGEKTISDVFKTRTYGDIKAIWDNTLPSCVDSGQALTDDSPSLRDLYPEMLDNAISKNESFKSIFDCLCYQSLHDDISYQDSLSSKLTGIIHNLIKDVIFNNWNIVRSRTDRQIGSTETLENNIDRIKIILLNNIKDGNILGRYYYEGLFKSLGINLDNEIQEYLNSWDENYLSSSFDVFRENIDYFLKRVEKKSITSIQRTGDSTVKISSLFGKGILGNTIIELIEYANKNFGDGVSEYNVVKINRTTSSVSCSITLEDLLKFRDTEDLRKEILDYKFSKILVYFDKDRSLE